MNAAKVDAAKVDAAKVDAAKADAAKVDAPPPPPPPPPPRGRDSHVRLPKKKSSRPFFRRGLDESATRERSCIKLAPQRPRFLNRRDINSGDSLYLSL